MTFKNIIGKYGIIALILLVLLVMLFMPPSMSLASSSSVSAVPSTSEVFPGDNFDVSIRVSTDVPTQGVQFGLSWDPDKIQCNGAEEGGFYRDFAQSHPGMGETILPDNPEWDNNSGKFPLGFSFIGIVLMGGLDKTGNIPCPAGVGDVYVFHMSAKSGASGTANFTLSKVILIDNDDNPLNVAVNYGQITIIWTGNTNLNNNTEPSNLEENNGQNTIVAASNTSIKVIAIACSVIIVTLLLFLGLAYKLGLLRKREF